MPEDDHGPPRAGLRRRFLAAPAGRFPHRRGGGGHGRGVCPGRRPRHAGPASSGLTTHGLRLMDLRPGTAADGDRQGLQRPRAGVRHAAGADRPGRVPGPAPPVVASGRFRRRHRAVGGADRLAERNLRPDQAARVAGRDQRRVVPVRTRHRRVGHRRRGGHRPGARRQAARPWGAGAVAFSIVMGLSRRLPRGPLALRRHRRDPARHLLRPGHRADSRPASAMAQQGAASCAAATPGWRSPALARREQ